MIKRIIYLVVLAFSVSSILYAQDESKPFSKYSIDVTYSTYPINYDYGLTEGNTMPTFSLAFDYRVFKSIYVGGFSGIGRYEEYVWVEPGVISDEGFYNWDKVSTAFIFGLNAKVYMLPFFLNNKDPWFNPYVSTKLGMNYKFSEGSNSRPKKGAYVDYALMFGASLYFGNHFGVFAEFGWGNSFNSRGGLTYRF